MNDENLQEVYYDRYCKTCEHKKLPEEADPCDECLSNPVMFGMNTMASVSHIQEPSLQPFLTTLSLIVVHFMRI